MLLYLIKPVVRDNPAQSARPAREGGNNERKAHECCRRGNCCAHRRQLQFDFLRYFDVESGRSRVLLADQRVLITKTIVDDKGATVRLVCAEPSPDAVTVFGASLAAAGALASGEQLGVSGGYQEAAASIGLRTASITLIRDIAYRACEARMNGAFDEDEYQKILAGMPAVVLGVFAIDGLTQMRAAPAVVVNAAAPKATADATAKKMPSSGEPRNGAAPSAKEGTATATTDGGSAPAAQIQQVTAPDNQYLKDVSVHVVNIVDKVINYTKSLHSETAKAKHQ